MLPREPGPPHPRTRPGTLSGGNCGVDFFKLKGLYCKTLIAVRMIHPSFVQQLLNARRVQGAGDHIEVNNVNGSLRPPGPVCPVWARIGLESARSGSGSGLCRLGRVPGHASQRRVEVFSTGNQNCPLNDSPHPQQRSIRVLLAF